MSEMKPTRESVLRSVLLPIVNDAYRCGRTEKQWDAGVFVDAILRAVDSFADAPAVPPTDAALAEAKRAGVVEVCTEVGGALLLASSYNVLVRGLRDVLAKYAPLRPYPSRTLADGSVFRQVGLNSFRWMNAEGTPRGEGDRSHWAGKYHTGTREELAAIDAVLAEAAERAR